MRYFFIEHAQSTGSTLVITGSDARHIKTVLRLKSGDKIGLFDGKGFEYEAKIVDLSTGRVKVSVIRRFPSTAESPVQITVAQGFLKEKKMDGLVRQLSELGIIKWIPFYRRKIRPETGQKTAVSTHETVGKNFKRGHQAVQAGLYYGNWRHGILRRNIESFSDLPTLRSLFGKMNCSPLNAELPRPDRKINKIYALLGPEGGFTQQEIESARDRGFVTASLGPRILRAETATVAACVLLQHLFGDMR